MRDRSDHSADAIRYSVGAKLAARLKPSVKQRIINGFVWTIRELIQLVAILGVAAAASLVGFIYLLVAVIVTTGMGALTGWIAGWFFPESFTAVSHLLGLQAPYQFGAVLGFVAGFFGGGVIKQKK